MSRRRKPRSGASRFVTVLIIAGTLSAAGYLWRNEIGWPNLLRRKPSAPSPATYQPTTAQPVGKSSVSSSGQLHFRRLTESGERLVAVTRALPGEVPAQAALQELISGEVPLKCERPLPQGTQLLAVRVEKGVATADFSQELQSSFQGGSDNEGVVVYAIVNTLNSLPTVERTQILVAGRKLDTLGGHIEIGEPLASNQELVIAR